MRVFIDGFHDHQACLLEKGERICVYVTLACASGQRYFGVDESRLGGKRCASENDEHVCVRRFPGCSRGFVSVIL